VAITGGAVTRLATNQAGPARLASDGTYLYWSNNLGGAIVRILEDGTGSPETIASATEPYSIAVDLTNVYWASNGVAGLWTLPKGPGSPNVMGTLIQNYSQFDALAVASGKLFAASAALWRINGSFNASAEPAGLDGPLGAANGILYGACSGGGFALDVVTGALTRANGMDPHPNLYFTDFRITAVGADACGAYVAASASYGDFNVQPNYETVYGIWMFAHTSDTPYGAFSPVATWVHPGAGPVGDVPLAGRVAAGGGYVFWAFPGKNSPTSHDGGIYRAARP